MQHYVKTSTNINITVLKLLENTNMKLLIEQVTEYNMFCTGMKL